MELRSRSQAKQPESRESQAHRIGWLVQPVVPERLIPVEAERCTRTHCLLSQGSDYPCRRAVAPNHESSDLRCRPVVRCGAPRISFRRWNRLNPIRSTAAFAFLFAAMHLYLKAIDLTAKRSLLSGGFQKHGKA